MSRSAVARSAVQALMGLALLVPTLLAQEPGETIEGVITEVDTRTITVARHGGGDVTVRVGTRTRVVMDPGEAAFFPKPTTSDLKAGMEVRFPYDEGVLERIHVTSVPPHLRPPRNIVPPGGFKTEPQAEPPRQEGRGDRRVVKARLQTIDDRRGEIRVDVAGRRESYRVSDNRMLRRFEQGDLVILTIEGRGPDEVVTEIKSAALTGRVTRVDRRRKEVSIDVDGREETYGVVRDSMLDDLRVGDRIRFEYEDRARGRNLITAIY